MVLATVLPLREFDPQLALDMLTTTNRETMRRIFHIASAASH